MGLWGVESMSGFIQFCWSYNSYRDVTKDQDTVTVCASVIVAVLNYSMGPQCGGIWVFGGHGMCIVSMPSNTPLGHG